MEQKAVLTDAEVLELVAALRHHVPHKPMRQGVLMVPKVARTDVEGQEFVARPVQTHVRPVQLHQIVPVQRQQPSLVQPSVEHNVIPVHAQAITSTHVAVPAINPVPAQRVTANINLVSVLADILGAIVVV